MNTYTKAITDLRYLCLLINRKARLNDIDYAKRFGTSIRHQHRQRRLLITLGAKLHFCRGRGTFLIDNDFHFGFGSERIPATAVADTQYLAALPAMEKGDSEFPVALYNRLRILAKMYLIILHSRKGCIESHSASLGITKKQWSMNLLILRNLGAEFRYDPKGRRYVPMNDFWIGLRVDRKEASGVNISQPEGGAIRRSAVSYRASAGRSRKGVGQPQRSW